MNTNCQWQPDGPHHHLQIIPNGQTERKPTHIYSVREEAIIARNY